MLHPAFEALVAHRRHPISSRTGVPCPVMSIRKHIFIVLVIGVITFGSAAFETAAAESPPGSTLRLVCPLH
jgi:hypothetical protein